MALYLCRWANGDFSVVQANNKEHAVEMLDEVANAEGLPLYAITDFMAHFRLTDEGIVELEGFGERFGDHVRKRVHPVLGELDVSPYDAAPEDRARIKTAVHLERGRLKAGPAPNLIRNLGSESRLKQTCPHPSSTGISILRQEKCSGKPSQKASLMSPSERIGNQWNTPGPIWTMISVEDSESGPIPQAVVILS